jgi:hypothetical protein
MDTIVRSILYKPEMDICLDYIDWDGGEARKI